MLLKISHKKVVLYISVLSMLLSYSTVTYSQIRHAVVPTVALPNQDFRKKGHYFGVNFSGNYSTIISYTKGLKSVHGGGANFGCVYEFQLNKILLSTGVSIAYMEGLNRLDDATAERRVLDTQENDYNIFYSFTDRKDVMSQTYLQLPLLVGMNIKSFYFLSGVKLALKVASSSTARADVLTVATYDNYYDPFEDMPNHGFVKKAAVDDRQEGIGTLFDMALSFEAGYNLKHHRPVKHPSGEIKKFANIFRVAMFFDYGFMNNYNKNKASSSLYQISESNPQSLSAIRMPHMYATQQKDMVYLTNLSVGVKLSFLFTTKR